MSVYSSERALIYKDSLHQLKFTLILKDCVDLRCLNSARWIVGFSLVAAGENINLNINIASSKKKNQSINK